MTQASQTTQNQTDTTGPDKFRYALVYSFVDPDGNLKLAVTSMRFKILIDSPPLIGQAARCLENSEARNVVVLGRLLLEQDDNDPDVTYACRATYIYNDEGRQRIGETTHYPRSSYITMDDIATILEQVRTLYHDAQLLSIELIAKKYSVID
jgi:hypothetical protein